MNYAWQLTVVALVGVLVSLHEVYASVQNRQALRELQVNGGKALIATNNLITSSIVLLCQIIALGFSLYFLWLERDFLSPVGSIMSLLLAVKTAYRWHNRRKLEQYFRDHYGLR